MLMLRYLVKSRKISRKRKYQTKISSTVSEENPQHQDISQNKIKEEIKKVKNTSQQNNQERQPTANQVQHYSRTEILF